MSILPKYSATYDLDSPPRPKDIVAKQRTTFDIEITVSRGGTAVDLTGVTPSLTFGPSDGSYSVAVTGSVTDAANGVCQITPSTTQTDYTGTHQMDLTLTSGSNVVIHKFGNLILHGRAANDVAGTSPSGTSLDWSQFTTGYSNTEASGPYTAGTNISFTAGTSGKITINANIPAGSGHTIQEEGVSLPQRTNLNFIGAAITAADDAGNDATTVTVDVSDKADDNAVVKLTGIQTVAGEKTFSSQLVTDSTNGIAGNSGHVSIKYEGGDAFVFDKSATHNESGLDILPNADSSLSLGSNLVRWLNGFFDTCTSTLFSGSGASLTNLPAGQLTGSVADARLSATALALPEISISPNDFDGPNATGSVDDCGFVPGSIDNGTYHIHGIGVDTASATQQSADYIAVVDVPDTWTAYATTECFRFVVWAESTTSTNCKYDLEISRTTSIGGSETTIYSVTNQTFSSASVPEEISIDRASLSDTTVADRLVIRFRLYTANDFATYIAGGACRGE